MGYSHRRDGKEQCQTQMDEGGPISGRNVVEQNTFDLPIAPLIGLRALRAG